MNKYIALGVGLGIVLVIVVGLAANIAFAQGGVPLTLAQMQQMHGAMHGAGTWDAMAQTMEQTLGKDWFNQMHGSSGADANHGMMGDGSGMMGNGLGMMSGNGLGNSTAVQADDNRAVDQTINITAQNSQFAPARVQVKAGQTVRFVIANKDSFAHNFVSAPARISGARDRCRRDRQISVDRADRGWNVSRSVHVSSGNVRGH